MKKFLNKITLFITLVIFGVLLLLNTYGGYLDYFYEKFTTPKQFSMILGDSRAMQGIQPAILDSCLINCNYKLPTYNFSFTIAQIAYGPSYLEAVKQKLDTSVSNQLFILSVNPWMLANRTPKDSIESDMIFQDSPPHNMKNMGMKPNVEYLIKNYNYFHFKAIFRKNSKMHKDGWLQENNLPTNNKVFESWKLNQIKVFQKWADKWQQSNYRLSWLQRTVTYLQQYGKVFIIRTPIDKEILDIENSFWSSFDYEMQNISVEHQCSYFNFTTNNSWKTYDGHHLDKHGGKLFTKELSKLILQH